MAKITVKGVEIGTVIEDLTECPEDAIWGRDLSHIFWMGVKAGMMAEHFEDIEVETASGQY